MSVCKVYCCGTETQDVVDDKTKKHIRKLQKHGLERSVRPELAVPAERRSPVRINIYDLSTRNKTLKKVGFGIFHVGVVVFEIEWSFGESLEHTNGTGLFCCQPGTAGSITRTMYLGETTLSPMQVDTILHRLENEWPSRGYHILHRNCNHFAQCFCDHLTTIQPLRIPPWCNRAARVADKVVPKKIATSVQRKVSGENGPPKASSSSSTRSAAAAAPHLPRSIIPHRWYANPSIVQPPKYRIHIGGTLATFSSTPQIALEGQTGSHGSPLGDGFSGQSDAGALFSSPATPMDAVASPSSDLAGDQHPRASSGSLISTFSAVEIEEIDPSQLRRDSRRHTAGCSPSPGSSTTATSASPLLRHMLFGRDPPASDVEQSPTMLTPGCSVDRETEAERPRPPPPAELPTTTENGDGFENQRSDNPSPPMTKRGAPPPPSPFYHATGSGALERATVFSSLGSTDGAALPSENANNNASPLEALEVKNNKRKNGPPSSLKYLDPNNDEAIVFDGK